MPTMLLLRISLAILTSSALLHIAPSVPLSETTQRHVLPVSDAFRPSPEPTTAFEPNTIIHGVPDDVFLTPSPMDPPPLQPRKKENFGLWPSGATEPEKTILLTGGEATFDATFTLILREGEDLKGMRHHPNDTSIITGFEEARQRLTGHHRFLSYNVTITHHFEGTVGVAEYELTIFTTMGATLRVSGIYYVAGVVVYASTDSKPLRIVSGRVSSPLIVESMYSFSHLFRRGHIMLPMKFQQVGPDVSVRPTPIADVLSKAHITVASLPSDDMPVLMMNARKCNAKRKKLIVHQKGSDSESCDVGLDTDSMSMVLRLHPERYGKAIIAIAFPAIRTDAEAFKTEIRLKVSKPAIRRPELVMKQDVHLHLDSYGTESFTLQMKNKGTSHRREILSYVVDLPGNRYATADFTSSVLAGPVQTISFNVISPGQEDKMLQEKIRRALMVVADSKSGDYGNAAVVEVRRLEHRTNQSHFSISHRESRRTSVTSFDLSSLALYDDVYSGDFDAIPVSRAQDKTQSYKSHVHAVLPSFDDLVTAQTPSDFVLWTSFAPKKLALVEALHVRTDRQNILMKLILLRYTASTFSQHKSMQISKYLSKEVSMLCRSSIQTASLVMLEDKGLNIEATYLVLVPQTYTDGVMEFNKHKRNITSSIAKNALLRDGRLRISQIIKLAVLGRPSEVNFTTSESPPRFRGLSGPLLAVIIVLTVVIVIPMVTVCIGCIIARRYTDEKSSSSDSPEGQEATEEDDGAKKSREDPQVATDVLRDNYGRAEDEEKYESFKVKTEMANEGYYGDKASSSREKSGSLWKS